MSQLVSDILINPVLRQARRFSRSGFLESNQSTPPSSGSHSNNHINALPPPQTAAAILEHSHSSLEHEANDSSRESYFAASLSSTNTPPVIAAPVAERFDTRQSIAMQRMPQESELTRQLALEANEGARGIENCPIPPDENGTTQVTSGGTSSPRLEALDTTQNSSSDSMREALNLDAAGSDGTEVQPLESSRVDAPTSLPENDGMGTLRHKIRLIQRMSIPAPEKARLMHELFTADYNNLQQVHAAAKYAARPHSPESIVSQEMPHSPGSPFRFWQAGSSPITSPSVTAHTFYLSPEDLEPTYAPLGPSEGDHGDWDEDERVMRTLGCEHYKRNVKLQCSACDKWYTCRFCHDEVEDHQLNRKETKNMLCMACGYAQPASDECIDCGISAACYYCRICKLWDNDPSKSIYHCDDCGICRVGQGLGKDFVHCKTCGICMSISRWADHRCLERSVDCNCPICEEYLLTSTRSVVFMRCGHCIHKDCYDSHLQLSYKCPICSKSTINMETQFLTLDRAIQSQPMPEQFQNTRALIKCNDCLVKCVVKYHWLGLKCTTCSSYNTRELQVLNETQAQALENYAAEQRAADTTVTSPTNLPSNTASASRAIRITIPSRLRRHSSHQGPIESANARQSSMLSLQSLRRRFGRSVSPRRELVAPIHEGVGDDAEDKPAGSDEEEEGVGFWGGLNTSSAAEASDDDDEELTSSESEQEEDEDDEDEDDDILGRMEFPGHR